MLYIGAQVLFIQISLTIESCWVRNRGFSIKDRKLQPSLPSLHGTRHRHAEWRACILTTVRCHGNSTCHTHPSYRTSKAHSSCIIHLQHESTIQIQNDLSVSLLYCWLFKINNQLSNCFKIGPILWIPKLSAPFCILTRNSILCVAKEIKMKLKIIPDKDVFQVLFWGNGWGQGCD